MSHTCTQIRAAAPHDHGRSTASQPAPAAFELTVDSTPETVNERLAQLAQRLKTFNLSPRAVGWRDVKAKKRLKVTTPYDTVAQAVRKALETSESPKAFMLECLTASATEHHAAAERRAVLVCTNCTAPAAAP